MKKVLIGVAAVAGAAALAYAGILAYATHAVMNIKFGPIEDEVAE